MKFKLLLLLLVFVQGSAKLLNAQEGSCNTPADTLVVLWSCGGPEVAEKTFFNRYSVTNDLKVCEVDVKGMGVTLTRYLKRGYKIISF